MKFIRLIVVIAIVFLAQTMLFSKVQGLRYVDLFLLLNLYFALNFGQVASMAFSVPSGLVQDAFTHVGILGMNAFSKTVVVFLISGLSSRLMIKHPLVIMVLIFISTHLDFLVIIGLKQLFRLPGSMLPYMPIFWAAVLNSMIGIVTFLMADRIRTRKEYA